MYGLSTSWNAHLHSDAAAIAEEIKRIGIEAVELNFKLSKETVDGFIRLADAGLIKILSLHNYCPVPDSVELKDASPDYYSLASIDEDERKTAVAQTRRTIDNARRMKAKAVVVHSGRANVTDRTRELAAAIETSQDIRGIAEDMQRKRQAEISKGYVEALIRSIGEIAGYGNECGIRIGLENRFYFRELPSIEEFEVIFREYPEDTNVYYWHDTGHAQVLANLGFASHIEYLKRFSSRMLGVHLHDIRGIIDDHKAPMTGRLDFSILAPFIKKDTIKIIEAHQPATAQEIMTGLECLKKILGE